MTAQDIKEQVQESVDNALKKAFEACFTNRTPAKSKKADKRNKEFAETFVKLAAEPIADGIVSALDAYIKDIHFFAKIITVGNKFTQMAIIKPVGSPIANGQVPNSGGFNTDKPSLA